MSSLDPRHRMAPEVEHLSGWRELGEMPTVEAPQVLPTDDPRWRVMSEKVGYMYYMREWRAIDENGMQHFRVEVGELGPVRWTDQI